MDTNIHTYTQAHRILFCNHAHTQKTTSVAAKACHGHLTPFAHSRRQIWELKTSQFHKRCYDEKTQKVRLNQSLTS